MLGYSITSISRGSVQRAIVEPAAVGRPLPAMPIFLDPYTYILAPLEETYMRTWEKCPRELREFVLNPPA
jgi:hypothetical protein